MLTINKSIRLEGKDYYANKYSKNLIVLHHTVGGSAISTIDYWKTDPKRIATAYIIERNGIVYEVFPPECWAFHIGIAGMGSLEKRSIGIELASEGSLTERDGRLYCYDKVSSRTLFTSEYYDNKVMWRGYRYFDAYSESQIKSTIELINLLCRQFAIPKQIYKNRNDHFLNNFETGCVGIVGHSYLRTDKSDVHPGFEWDKVIEECGLKVV